MLNPNDQNLIQRLISLPRGRPVNTRTLKSLGISPPLASYYVRAGWLTRLGRGAFALKGDTLHLSPSVAFLAWSFSNLHVGGRTALSWRGVHHNLAAREKLVLWGSKKGPLPPWFVERFPAEYVTRQLFDPQMEAGYAVSHLPGEQNGAAVSEPERALLEMLDAVGVSQEVDEAKKIMAGLRSVRVEVLGHLLVHCRRVKVVRLCVQWADELRLPWAMDAAELPGSKGTGRWIKKLPDGSTLVLKP